RRELPAEAGRHALLLPFADAVLVARTHGRGQDALARADGLEAVAVALHRAGDVGDRARPRQQPTGERALQVPDHLQGVHLRRLVHLAVERVDPGPQLARVQGLAGDGERLGDLARGAPAVLLHAQ